MSAKTDHLLVDPDVNIVYSTRKRQRLNQDTAPQPVQADEMLKTRQQTCRSQQMDDDDVPHDRTRLPYENTE